jgi:hypothetical protein
MFGERKRRDVHFRRDLIAVEARGSGKDNKMFYDYAAGGDWWGDGAELINSDTLCLRVEV